MAKYYSNADSSSQLDPDLQKWLLNECDSIDASVVVAYIREKDIQDLKKDIRHFIYLLIFNVGLFVGVYLLLLFG